MMCGYITHSLKTMSFYSKLSCHNRVIMLVLRNMILRSQTAEKCGHVRNFVAHVIIFLTIFSVLELCC